jgi:hypothetical protein
MEWPPLFEKMDYHEEVDSKTSLGYQAAKDHGTLYIKPFRRLAAADSHIGDWTFVLRMNNVCELERWRPRYLNKSLDCLGLRD